MRSAPRGVILFSFFLLWLFGCSQNEQEELQQPVAKEHVNDVVDTSKEAKTDERPNILLVVIDDIAFSDIGVFGSEIATPNIDALANDGVLLTGFHTAANCSPTRAMLLSGVDSHIAGLGNMAEEMAPNQKGQPGYEGYLNFNVAALPEVLLDAGYHTYMTGKWHLGLTRETSPVARGFEKSFALLQGGAGAFSNMLQVIGPNKARYMEDGEPVEALPDDFYSSRFYAERMIEYIESNRTDNKPFFSYLAFTSPHWPLQAPDASIRKYQGKYDQGYDALRSARLNQLKTLGFVDQDVEPYPRLQGEAAWEELSEEQRRYEAKKMEIYAAMIDDVDIYLGKVIQYLKDSGEYDNTLVFLMSDNGPEGHDFPDDWLNLGAHIKSCCDNSYENMGKPDSYIWYGPNWAMAGNPPLRMYKGFPSQGGINVPALFHFPKSIQTGKRNDSFVHVMDVMPTLLEIAGVEQPETSFRGREVKPISGKSMIPMLTGQTENIHPEDHISAWELFGKRAIRQGEWKLLLEPEPYGTGEWQLYNLTDDPVELNDLAGTNPEKRRELLGLWDEYARTNNVILPDQVSFY